MKWYLFIVLVLITHFTGSIFSQTTEKKSLSSVLNADGTLKENINGSFDATGYTVATYTDGHPRFQKKQGPEKTQSINFSTIGGTYGATGNNQSIIACVLVNGSDIYLGGWMTVAGTAVAKGIMKWNGSQWVSFGTGLDGQVFAMTIIGTDLYACGNFITAGSLTVNYIAKWNGSEWSALAGGTNNSVKSLCSDGINLYAGGNFTTAGSTGANYIAKWDGSAWSALGSGMNGSVEGIYYSGGTLYAGGTFTTAGGSSAKRIAYWNGTVWAELGTGVLGSSAYILEISVFGGVVYVAGKFTTADGNAGSYLMGWSGSNWTAPGAGLNNQVYSMASDASYLYVGGVFTTAGGSSSPYAARWDGSAWTSFGTELTGQIDGLAAANGKLYLAGRFPQKFAIWNGSFSYDPAPSTDVITSGLSVTSVCSNGNDIYIGGNFSNVGGVAVNNIAKWDGTSWVGLGTGVIGGFSPAPIQALAHDGTYLYAGGYFTNAGGSSINYLAKWDGSVWSSVGENPDNPVWDIEIGEGKLYICGSFTTMGSTSANRIAVYDGGNWSALGTGLGGITFALAIDGDNIYAIGSFTTAGGSPTSYIAKWNGSAWSALGSGLNNSGRDIKFHNGKLYACGLFTMAGGIGAMKCAVWDGFSWSSLSTGLSDAAETIEACGNDIYFGGSFSVAGGINTAFIAKWNGTAWVDIGSGTDGVVRALCVQTSTGSMIFGGDFLVSNSNIFTQRIAKFTDSDNPLPVELVSFSGRFAGNSIQLNWQTATEIDNNGYAIERKTPKSEWQKIGFIEGHGMCNSPKYYSFSDNTVMPGGKYSYRLKQIDGDGTFTYSNTIEISTSAITDFTLEQNYPNPFNPETIIRFVLPVSGEIRLELFSPLGEKISILTEGFRESGVYSVGFNAQNLSAGVYFYTLRQNDRSITRKMVLTKQVLK